MRRSALKVIWLLAILVAWAPIQAAEPDPGGHWEGAIEIPGQPLEVMIDLTRDGDGWKGTIDIPAQSAQGLPLIIKSVEGKKLQLQIANVPGEPLFTGDLSDDNSEIKGTFAQGGAVFAFALTSGEDPVAAAKKRLEEVPEMITEMINDWNAVSTSVAVVYRDQVIMAEGFGFRDSEKELPADADTLYAIGSSSKAFTTFVMAQLAEQGKLDWDAPVADQLPDFKMYDPVTTARLTPRDMVTHRSGLPRHDMLWYGNDTLSRKDFVLRLRYLEPNKELRETWQYNNLMYMTAGYLTEHITGMSWEDSVRTKIFEPLGMKRTNFDVRVSAKDPNHALPYAVNDDDEPMRLDWRPLEAGGPAGSINSSANEMTRWMRAHLNGGTVDGTTVLTAPATKELHTPQMVISGLPEEPYASPSSYAMGWFTDTLRGHYRVQHGGNIDGFSALVTLYPRDQLGIVAFTNQNGSAVPSLATALIADRVLGLEPRDWVAEATTQRDAAKLVGDQAEDQKDMFRKKDTQPSRELSAFEGEYAHPGYGTLEIKRDGDRLVAHYNTLTLPLEHWHYDVFNVVDLDDRDSEQIPEDLRFSFEGDTSGRIRVLKAPLEPLIAPIEFVRQAGKRMRDPEFLSRLEGNYALGPQRIAIRVQGDGIVADMQGGQTLKLNAVDDLEFELEVVKGYFVRFTLEEDGPASQLTFIQPDGVYTAERMKDE